jgi:hypothetical protein
MVTQDEILAYVARGFEGEKTAAEIQAEAQEMFDRYNRWSLEHDRQQVIEKHEAWRVASDDDHEREEQKRDLTRLRY